jgi:cysteine synthase A
VIFPDEGYRYQDTVYDDAWLAAKGLLLDELPREPVEWAHPHDGDDPWSFHRWGRRTFAEVMQSPASALELVA